MIEICVKKTISEYKHLPISRIEHASLLVDDLGFNSFEILDLSCRFEEEYNIHIEEVSLQNWRTVGDVIARLETILASDAYGYP